LGVNEISCQRKFGDLRYRKTMITFKKKMERRSESFFAEYVRGSVKHNPIAQLSRRVTWSVSHPKKRPEKGILKI